MPHAAKPLLIETSPFPSIPQTKTRGNPVDPSLSCNYPSHYSYPADSSSFSRLLLKRDGGSSSGALARFAGVTLSTTFSSVFSSVSSSTLTGDADRSLGLSSLLPLRPLCPSRPSFFFSSLLSSLLFDIFISLNAENRRTLRSF